MITRTFRLPMSHFDTTPIGRIVNRFAKDVDVVDNLIPSSIRTALLCFLSVCWKTVSKFDVCMFVVSNQGKF
jgi:ATP-binding cassette subfamily C (CFTR/MRP) protein 1